MKVIESPVSSRAHPAVSVRTRTVSSAVASTRSPAVLPPPVVTTTSKTAARFDLKQAILTWLRKHPHMIGVQIVAGGPHGLARNERFRALQQAAGANPADERVVSKALQTLMRDTAIRSKYKLRVAAGRAGSTWRDMLEGPTGEIWNILHKRSGGSSAGTRWKAVALQKSHTSHVRGVPLAEVCRKILAVRDEAGRQKFHVCPFTVRRLLNDWGYKVDTSATRPWVHPKVMNGLAGAIIKDLERHGGGARISDAAVRDELISAGVAVLHGEYVYPQRTSKTPSLSAKAQRALKQLEKQYEGSTAEEITARLQKSVGSKLRVSLDLVKARLEAFRYPDGAYSVFDRNPDDRALWRLTGLHHGFLGFEKQLAAALRDIKRKDPARLRQKIVGPGGVLEALADRGIFWPNLTADEVRKFVNFEGKLKSPRKMSAFYEAELDKLLPEIITKAKIKSKEYPGDLCYRLKRGRYKGHLVPVVRDDGTIIVGSAPGESPQRYPHGNGICGVLGQKGSPVNPSKRVVQVALLRLKYPTPRARAARTERTERLKKLRRHVIAAVARMRPVKVGDKRFIRLKGANGLMTVLRGRGVSALADDVAHTLDSLGIERERRPGASVEAA